MKGLSFPKRKALVPKIMPFPRGVYDRPRDKGALPFARWLMDEEILDGRFRYIPGQSIFLGQWKGQFIGSNDDRHILTVAGSRTGKSSAALIPNLLDYRGATIVIDPKGELARETALWRNKPDGADQPVHIFDPFGTVRGKAADLPKARFNPMDLLSVDPEDENLVDDADMMAESLVPEDPGRGADHWTAAARNIVKGIILHVALNSDPEDRTLLSVRRFLTDTEFEKADDTDGDSLLDVMEMGAGGGGAFDVVAGEAATIRTMGPTERGSVLSVARTQTKFLSSPQMKDVLSSSPKPFRFETLKDRPATVYLCLPAMRMGTHSQWLRLMINMAFGAMERNETIPKLPVLFILEEFPVLGHMKQIETAAGLMAGFGVKLWTVVQDFGQLKSLYRDRWETFLGNAGVLQAFGNNDVLTLDYLSKRLGRTFFVQREERHVGSGQAQHGEIGERESAQSSALLDPAELAIWFGRHKDKKEQPQLQLLIIGDQHPVVIERVAYYEHEYFKGRYA